MPLSRLGPHVRIRQIVDNQYWQPLSAAAPPLCVSHTVKSARYQNFTHCDVYFHVIIVCTNQFGLVLIQCAWEEVKSPIERGHWSLKNRFDNAHRYKPFEHVGE